jgi:hypothetical protein
MAMLITLITPSVISAICEPHHAMFNRKVKEGKEGE